MIGGINIRFDVANRVGELGYSIARPYWGRGLATEAARAAMDAAFSAYADLNRMRAMADARNVPSLRVMEKLGMVREGVLRQNRRCEASSLTRSGAVCCAPNGQPNGIDVRAA